MKYIENIIPILAVANIQKSMNYYTKVLGFDTDWQDGKIGQIGRDGFGIMLKEVENPCPQEVWIGLEVLRPLYEEYKEKAAIITQSPENHTWALDMKISDPDGNILWFGTAPE